MKLSFQVRQVTITNAPNGSEMRAIRLALIDPDSEMEHGQIELMLVKASARTFQVGDVYSVSMAEER